MPAVALHLVALIADKLFNVKGGLDKAQQRSPSTALRRFLCLNFMFF